MREGPFVVPPLVSLSGHFCRWIYGHGGGRGGGAAREAGKPGSLASLKHLHEEQPYLQGPFLAEPLVSVLRETLLFSPSHNTDFIGTNKRLWTPEPSYPART